MRSVVTLITLGVDDLPRARAFYVALGWREASGSSEEIAFLHGIGPALGLWSRAALAEDSGVAQDPGGWGGITLAHNVGSPDEVDAVLAEAQDAGGTRHRVTLRHLLAEVHSPGGSSPGHRRGDGEEKILKWTLRKRARSDGRCGMSATIGASR